MAASSNIDVPSRPQPSPPGSDAVLAQGSPVIPAEAGTQGGGSRSSALDPRFRGGDDNLAKPGQDPPRIWRAIGLMSGTSLDGIDVAIIETDGRDRVIPGAALTFPYPPHFRERLRSVLGGVGPFAEGEEELTRRHAEAVDNCLGPHP